MSAAHLLTVLPPPSPLASDKEIRLIPFSNSSRVTQFSREVIRTQGEWEFLQLSVSSTNFTMQDRIWQNLVYTVGIEERRAIGRVDARGPGSPDFLPS